MTEPSEFEPLKFYCTFVTAKKGETITILALTISNFTLQGVRSAMDTLKELVLQNCEGISKFCTI